MFQIADIKINSPIIVAPMAGISNDAFRQLCFEFNAGLVYSEMVSDKAIFYKNERTLKMLEVPKSEHPVSLQLFGSDINTMVYAAKILDNETNCNLIDINMGCPVNKVIKTGAGSALMKDEDNTVHIIEEIVKSVRKPVTVKMRLGFTVDTMNYLSLAMKLEGVGVSAIALHARTRSQMYEGKADWSHIKVLKDNLHIPVIGNGDVKSVEDFITMKNTTNCDGVMIGRALLGNPFLIKEIDNYLNDIKDYEVTIEDKFNYCLKHCEKLIALYNEKLAISMMRGIAPHYLSGLYNSTTYKEKMNHINSYDDLNNILVEYKKYLDDYSSSNNKDLNSFKG